MRRLPLLVGVLTVISACGAPVVAPNPAPVEPVTVETIRTTTTTPTVQPSTTTTFPPAEDVALSTSSLPDHATLVARAGSAVEVYEEVGTGAPIRVVEPTTILGTSTVFTVIEGPDRGWLRVMLPGRPNGAEGWVRQEDLDLFVVDSRIVVDLSERSLAYYESGEEVLTTTVAVGSSRYPTPTGTFFVTDSVTLTDPDSVWGPHALGLSARSEVITEYNGGDGIIGIHGTSRPGSIGEAASLGCVRVPNDVIALLHELVPLGTPVEITT